MNAAKKLPRLPRGRHGLPPEVVITNQRERLIEAFSQVVVEKGYPETTITDITQLAAVSRNVFYELFGSKDECFIAAYETVRAHLRALMAEAAEPYPDRPEKLVAALRTFLSFFAAYPDLARLCLLEPQNAGRLMIAHHEEALRVLAQRLHTGMDSAAPEEPAMIGDLVIVLGVVSLITQAIEYGEAEQLEDLLPSLVRVLLAPLGETQVDEILARVSGGAPEATFD